MLLWGSPAINGHHDYDDDDDDYDDYTTRISIVHGKFVTSILFFYFSMRRPQRNDEVGHSEVLDEKSRVK